MGTLQARRKLPQWSRGPYAKGALRFLGYPRIEHFRTGGEQCMSESTRISSPTQFCISSSACSLSLHVSPHRDFARNLRKLRSASLRRILMPTTKSWSKQWGLFRTTSKTSHSLIRSAHPGMTYGSSTEALLPQAPFTAAGAQGSGIDLNH